MMRRLIAIFVLCAAATVAEAGGVLRSGHPGEPDSLDPHVAVAAPALIVNNDLFESLLTLDARGRPVPGAAERYEVSADSLTYTFTLRAGLTYSDGRPITATDFVWSMRRLADPATAATGLAAWIDLIEGGRAVLRGKRPPETLGVSARDARTVRVRLALPAPYFPSIVAFPVFAPLPRHVIEKHGRAWTRPENFVGNGPFVLSSWIPGQPVRVKRNPRFHAAASVKLDGVEYHAIGDLNSGLRRFLTGDLDALTNFPPEKLDWLRAEAPRELRLAPSLGVTAYIFNQRLPKFRDVRIRHALALAIDRDVLTRNIVRAGDRPAWSLIPPGVPGFPKARTVNGSQADRVALARQLMRAAGYGPARPFELELLYHTSEEHKKVAVAIAAMWQQIGVKVSLRNAERQVVEVATRNGDFEVVRAALFSPYLDATGFFSFLRRGSPSNGGAYDNESFEQLLDSAARSTDPAKRLALLAEAEQLLVNDRALIPLYYLVSRRLVSRRVIGWRDDNLTALRPARWLDLRAP